MPQDHERASALLPAALAPRSLTVAEFHQLTDVPPALTWFANIDKPQTKRAYQNDVEEFMDFSGIQDPMLLMLSPFSYMPTAAYQNFEANSTTISRF